MKGERSRKCLVQVAHRHNPYGKKGKGTDIPSQTSEVGRDPHPLGHARHRYTIGGHTQSDQRGGQRPSPTRAPTRTSRRAGIGQGDLPHTKVATSASRMYGNYKEQYGSHSLNRWKERLALQHRHAGMSTGREPYILRGILSEGAQALMTRLGPSYDEGPGTQPT